MLNFKFHIFEGSAGAEVCFPPTRALENRWVRLFLVLRAPARFSMTVVLQASMDSIHWVEVRTWDARRGCTDFPVLFCEWPLLRVVISSHGGMPATGEISLTELPPATAGSEKKSAS